MCHVPLVYSGNLSPNIGVKQTESNSFGMKSPKLVSMNRSHRWCDIPRKTGFVRGWSAESSRSWPVLVPGVFLLFWYCFWTTSLSLVANRDLYQSQLVPWIRLHRVLSCVYNGAFVSEKPQDIFKWTLTEGIWSAFGWFVALIFWQEVGVISLLSWPCSILSSSTRYSF